MAERGSVTHYVDEDWAPLCRGGRQFDMMWAFDDELITCPDCLAQLRPDERPAAEDLRHCYEGDPQSGRP